MRRQGDDPASAVAFYDDLAEHYHLVYANWEASLAAQATALASVIRERWQPAHRILDAACGIGTQALGLAMAGFDVVGSDLSPRALARARREAGARGLTLALTVADLRTLDAVHQPGFDVVMACDNALPHLLTDGEILTALCQMRALLRPGGGCLVSVRDYAAVEQRGTQMVPYGVRETPEGRVAVFQDWDFRDAGVYDLSLVFVHGLDAAPRTKIFRARYRAIAVSRLAELMRQAGFEAVEAVRERFFQPLLVGTNRAPADG